VVSIDLGVETLCRHRPGILFRLTPQNLEEQLGKLVRREMTVKPPNNLTRRISV